MQFRIQIKQKKCRLISLAVMKNVLERRIKLKLIKLRHTVYNLQKFVHYYNLVIHNQMFQLAQQWDALIHTIAKTITPEFTADLKKEDKQKTEPVQDMRASERRQPNLAHSHKYHKYLEILAGGKKKTVLGLIVTFTLGLNDENILTTQTRTEKNIKKNALRRMDSHYKTHESDNAIPNVTFLPFSEHG